MKHYLITALAILCLAGAPAAFAKKFAPDSIGQAKVETINEYYEAVGTVRPHTETNIGSQVTAQVVQVKVRPGNKVQKGDVLVLLDSRKFLSRLDQSREGLKSAIAGRDQAKQAIQSAKAAFEEAQSNYNRIKNFYQSQAATTRQLEQAESAFLQARAGLERAREALSGANAQIRQAEEVVREAEIAMGYTKITAPESGEVLKRMVEPGDLALPGKPLIVLQSKGLLLLEAHVREGLVRNVKVGTELEVSIETLNEVVEANVEEIIPYADPQTRTFLVKAALPRISGLYPGMFGKLLIPVKEVKVVVIPKNAVRHVGQLELVYVKEGEQWQSRFIKTGKILNGKVEVLSGLTGNETIGIKE